MPEQEIVVSERTLRSREKLTGPDELEKYLVAHASSVEVTKIEPKTLTLQIVDPNGSDGATLALNKKEAKFLQHSLDQFLRLSSPVVVKPQETVSFRSRGHLVTSMQAEVDVSFLTMTVKAEEFSYELTRASAKRLRDAINQFLSEGKVER